jgi:preprotein translocase subunit YajC
LHGIGFHSGWHAQPQFDKGLPMFISPAYAQSPFGAGGSEILFNMLPLLAMFVIFYFLLIRPQQARQKQHQALVAEIDVEIAKDTVVKVLRGTISTVRNKTDAPKEA